MLVRLLYASRPTDKNTAASVEAIVAKSRTYNPEHGITGILCHSGDIFMQVLEGGREAVNQLYNTLITDPRHRDVIVLQYEEVTERRFSGWTMGQVDLNKVNLSVVLKYSEKAVLDPYAVSGKVSAAMIEELMLTASVAARG